MLLTGSYQAQDVIYSSEDTIIYRGSDRAGKPAILKVLNNSHPDPEQLARFQLEYEMIRKFDSGSDKDACVIKAYNLVKHHNSLIIVLEDINGHSLHSYLKDKILTVSEFLPLAILITKCLGQIHQHFIIHKDINPSNIIWNPQNGLVRIIDFGISTTLTKEHMEVWNQQNLDGTIAYISPEQTGRMNRPMDFRTDLYSLGATFYCMLTGKPPFPSSAFLETIHSHLARKPIPLHTNYSHIPKTLSDIVSKLLSKEAEQRYQTAAGLQKDLNTCLEQWQNQRVINSFDLGRLDVFPRFTIPQKLFGRDDAIDKLGDAYNRASQGSSEFMFVKGGAGIGKSSIAHEAGRHIVLNGGYFVSGKFNQSDTNTIYGPIIQAFRALIRQLMAENTTQILLWKEKLVEVLEARSALVCHMIPELESIFGPQNKAVIPSPRQYRDQFQIAFLDMVKTICQENKALTIFLDDLQWADPQSLKLLERILIDPDLKYFLLIIAYRGNTPNATHHLAAFERLIGQTVESRQIIELTSLRYTDVSQLLVASTHCNTQYVAPLARLCMEKTKGNPFFLKQFLFSLYGEGLLYMQNGSWLWDLDSIRRQAVTDNVVDLLINNIQKQDQKTQEAIQAASCIGLTFDLETLAILLGWTTRDTVSNCQEALQQGLIMPLEGEHTLTSYLENPKVSYQFTHDRVYHATYEMVDTEQRTKNHLKIGRLLQQRISSENNSDYLLSTTNHLNLSLSLMSSNEQYQLAILNLQAGRQAMLSAAHYSAFDYFETGLNILGKDGWLSHYDLTLQLHNSASEVAYAAGHQKRLLELVESVNLNVHTTLDSVKAQESRIIANTSSMQFLEALNNGLDLLRMLGLSLPDEEPSDKQVKKEWALLEDALTDKSVEWFLDLPQINDVQAESIIRVISTITPVATILASRWMPFLLVKGMQKIIESGNSNFSSLIVCDYAYALLCGIRDDIDSGYQTGQLAIHLLEKYPNDRHKMRVFFMYTAGIRHWKEPYLQTILPSYELGIKNGLEIGDTENVSYFIYVYAAQSFFFGNKLSVADEKTRAYRNILITIKSLAVIGLVDIVHQAILNLIGHAKRPHLLVGDKYNEIDELPQLVKTGAKFIVCNVSIIQLILRFIFRQFNDCAAIIDRIIDNQESIIGNAQVPIFVFFDSLYHLAVYTDGEIDQQQQWMKRVNANQKQMKKWAKYGPMNLEKMVQLVEAERFRILGESSKAHEAYNRAIELARKHEFIHIEAIAFELAGYFYMQQGVEHLTRYHLSEARYAYARWGANAKVAELDAKYPGFFLTYTKSSHPLDVSWPNHSHLSKTTSAQSMTMPFNLPSVIKASQAISKEIDLNKLGNRLLHVVMENAGAQRGCLIAVEKGEMSLLAVVCENGEPNQEIEESVLVKTELFSEEVVQFISRSKEPLVLDDASKSYNFANTDYVIRNNPKSLLCVPLLNQGQVSHIIYLENNLTTHSFTPFQVEAISILGTQAAISFTNAQVVNELKQAEKELLKSQRQLRDLSRHQHLLLENEQKRISLEVHDELGSLLTRIRLEIDLLLADHGQATIQAQREDIIELSGIIAQALTTVRRIASALRPKTLDQCGLLPALEWQAHQYKNHFSVLILPNSKNIRLDDEREIILFRIGQEAITNIARHAGASQVSMFFGFNEKEISLKISDDGCGIQPSKLAGPGMGIDGMKERVQQLRGTIQFLTPKSGGTLVEIIIPRTLQDIYEEGL
ncbi:MAG: AAA family ATPase [Magnetococcales bacterium]|nr:AAA family ATPase [Magnetococcales bacterium]